MLSYQILQHLHTHILTQISLNLGQGLTLRQHSIFPMPSTSSYGEGINNLADLNQNTSELFLQIVGHC